MEMKSFRNHRETTNDTVEGILKKKKDATKELILKLAKDVSIKNHLRKVHDIEKATHSTQLSSSRTPFGF